MATANLTTLDALLKEHVIDEVIESLNNEVDVFRLFEKGSFSWRGRLVRIAIHVARNSGVHFSGNGTLPTAGVQGWEHMEVLAERLYGRGEIDGEAIEAFGDDDSVIDDTEAEMNMLKKDVKNASNRAMVSGGTVIGFMYEQNALSVAGAPDDWLFDGDFDRINDLLAIAAPLEIRLIRFSDKLVHPGGATSPVLAAGQGISAADKAAGTITLDEGLNTSAGVGAGDWGAAATLEAGDVYAVEIIGPAVVMSDVNQVGLNHESLGVYSNLGLVAPFGISAATAGGFESMQATGFSTLAIPAGAPAAPAGVRLPLDLADHLQECRDRIFDKAGEEVDCWLTSVKQRSKYVALSVGTIQTDFTNRGKPGGLDQGFAIDGNKQMSGGGGLGFGGTPVYVSRHVASGHWIGLKRDSWRVAERGNRGMHFMQKDGAVLSRVQDRDAYEFTLKWYYNLVCVAPNCNGVIAGLEI